MVYSTQQLANLIRKPKTIAKVYANRLVKKTLAKQLIRGKISFTDDDFVISCQMVEPSYISLESALLFHNIVQQVPKEMTCVTTKNSLKYPELGIKYHKISSSLFFGYSKFKKDNSYVYVADPEKALIDGVYLNIFSKKNYVEFKEKLDKNKIEKYLLKLKCRGKNKIKKVFKND